MCGIVCFLSYSGRKAIDDVRLRQNGCRYLATDKYKVKPDDDGLGEMLPRILWHLEEPPMAHGVYSRWHFAQLASQHVKVLLVGQGAELGPVTGDTKGLGSPDQGGFDAIKRVGTPYHQTGTWSN